MELELGQATDPGRDPSKRVNEDAAGSAHTPVGRLFVVCDGMGGHQAGKEAAELAVKTIIDMVASAQPTAEPVHVLRAAVEQAGRRVFEYGGPQENVHRPGATCVAVLLHHGYAEVAHVGDSRAYAIRGKQIFPLTRDHSMVQDMIDAGQLTEQQAIGHPDGNKITRALGMKPMVEVETRDEPMELFDGDVLVLGSDGLTDLVQKNDIVVTVNSYLKSADLQTAANELVALANRRGGHDNITVQVVRILRAGMKVAQTRVQGPQGIPPTMMQGPAGLNPMGQPGPGQAFPGQAFPGQAGPPPQQQSSSALPFIIIGVLAVVGVLVAVVVYVLKEKAQPTVVASATASEEEDEPPPPPPPPKPKPSAKPKGSASASSSSKTKAPPGKAPPTKAPATKK